MSRIAAINSSPYFTLGLIAISVALTLITGFGQRVVGPLMISQFYGQGLVEVRAGELWRLITPIFIHLGLLHILFNMMWLWDLGRGIEYRFGMQTLGLLVITLGVASNLAQFYYAGPAFGGMSGVVYGLLGYVWMQSRFNPSSGLFLQKAVVVMMLVWYGLCWTGLVGPIANMAHTAGLAVGVIWGLIAAKMARQ